MSSVMENQKLPAAVVRAFIKDAERAGVYSPHQATLFRVALNVQGRNLPQKEMSVADLLANVGVLEKDAKSSPASIRSYQSRLRRLFDDFLKLNGRDFDELRRERGPRSRPRQEASMQQLTFAALGATDSPALFPVRLPTGRFGEIRLPRDLTADEARVAAQQLVQIARYIDPTLAPPARTLGKGDHDGDR